MNPSRSEIAAFVEGCLAGVFRPEPDEEIWEWAERCLRIPATENAEMAGQLWSSYYSPYVREIMEWVKRPGKGEMFVKKSSQVGITMAALIIICWFIVHRGGAIGYAIDTVEEARRISKTRLQQWLKQNKILDELGEDPDDVSNLTFYLSGITVYMMGAQSGTTFQNKSTVLFILDELDEHAFIEGGGTTTDLARDRCKVPKNAKLLGFCKPGKSGLITKEHAAGTCEEIVFPFPCGHRQALNWDRMIFGTDEFREHPELDLEDGQDAPYNLEKVKADTYFECEVEGCECRLFDHQKMKLMQDFASVPTNVSAMPGVRSMHIWDAYSSFVTFGELALEWIKAQGDDAKIQAFIRGRRGMHYEESGGAVTESELLDLRGAYKRGTCPTGIKVGILGMSVDIQDELLLKATKAIYTPEGIRYVIDWGVFVSFEDLVEWADMPLHTPDGPMVVHAGFIDEGNDKEDVRRFALAHPGRFHALKGRGEGQIKGLLTKSESWMEGRVVETYHIDDNSFKWKLLKSLRRGQYSESHQKQIRKTYLPYDVINDENFLDELTKEVPVRKLNKYGAMAWGWKKTGANDWWDTLKYLDCLYFLYEPRIKAIHFPEEVA